MLKRVASLVGVELGRQPKEMVDFIDPDGEEFRGRAHLHRRVQRGGGCGWAPSTYWAATKRTLSKWARRGAAMTLVLVKLGEDNCGGYGARTLWRAAGRAGGDVGGDQVARLVKAAGITGGDRCTKVPHHQARPGC
jgi:putative transposase